MNVYVLYDVISMFVNYVICDQDHYKKRRI